MDFKDYRRGRKVRGPGTETSDSIPALLSKNEFVIKAKSAKKLGFKNLAHMNRTGEFPMRMKKSNPKQASDMGAGYKGGGRMKLKGYQEGGKLDDEPLTPIRRQFKPLVPGIGEPNKVPDTPPRVNQPAAPKPAGVDLKSFTPRDDMDLAAMKDVRGGTSRAVSGMAESVKRWDKSPRSWMNSLFAKGGGVLRCAACGGKMSAGGKCMSCGGAKPAGLKAATKGAGANR